MFGTTKGNRLHIGVFGRRNVGKSSLLNKLTGQKMSIVSDTLGTTTDPIEKSMELLPLGPCLFIDTAGIDDVGSLGQLRIKKTLDVLQRTDFAILVTDFNGFGEFEIELCKMFEKQKIPYFVVINKCDIQNPTIDAINKIEEYTKNPLCISCEKDENITSLLKSKIIENVPDDLISTTNVLEGTVFENDDVVLVIPIDKEAPKGRIILPQVQTIRSILDLNAKAHVVKETQLKELLDDLKEKTKIVITDSQAFKEVSQVVPKNIPLTSFSILFARNKGDLKTFYQGANKIDNLKDNDNILIYESCTHHPIKDDIAREKIPKWLKQYTGKNLNFDYHVAKGFEDNISKYSLIIQCGGCMTNKKEILSRVSKANELNIPITNYGLVIAKCLKILNRAIEPFVDETLNN